MFDLKSWFAHPSGPFLISGPCSVESEKQMMEIALALSKITQVKVLRGGIWKPRTRPSDFEGKGEEGLRWLLQAKRETGLLTATEVAIPAHVELALKYEVDALWIGARTVVNPFSIQALADALKGTDIPVFIKNPVSPDLKLWIGAFERLQKAGVIRLAGIHRGFQHYKETPYRNFPMWEIPIGLVQKLNVPIVTDISHMCGNRDLLQTTAQYALDLASDGLMIECHCHPEAALTDSQQQITPDSLKELIDKLEFRSKTSGMSERDLAGMRSEIDDIDKELLQLLARRMDLSTQIGQYKKSHNVTVVQMDRWNKILADHLAMAETLGLEKDMVQSLFEAIHKASVDRQARLDT